MTLYTYPLIDIQGPTGPTGPTGALGYTGSQGTGYTGSASTVAGPTGVTGPIGEVGYTGSLGYTGSVGFTGSAGLDGDVGFRGSAGYTGSRGYTGSVGYTGSQGPTGYTGSVGLRGFTGDTGYTGSQGFTGSAGVTGYAGSQGLRGFTGDTGYTGSVGPDGNAGFRGSAGYTGSQGYTGSRGYTGSAGLDGNVGFRGSAGYTGSVGFVGSLGYTGSAGLDGNVGFRGSAGYTGSVGFVGSRGYTGSIGYTGSAGAGFTGSVGLGSPGYTGSIGFTGSEGIRGQKGDLGYTGSSGASVTGFTGSAGITGYTGSQGPAGNNSLGYIGSSTAASPGLRTINLVNNTGLYASNTTEVGISTGGTARVLVNNSQTQITNPLSVLGATATFTSGSNQILLNTSGGGMEVTRSTGSPFIDLKDNIADDYEVRLTSVNNSFRITVTDTVNTNSFNLTSTGYLGIGTTTPSSPVHVVNATGQTAGLSGVWEGVSVKLATYAPGIFLLDRSSGTLNSLISQNDNAFSVYTTESIDGTSLVERLRITTADMFFNSTNTVIHSGNIGSFAVPVAGGTVSDTLTVTNNLIVGTTISNTRLDVISGNTPLMRLYRRNNLNNSVIQFSTSNNFPTVTNDLFIGHAGTNQFAIGNSATLSTTANQFYSVDVNTHIFRSSGSESMRISRGSLGGVSSALVSVNTTNQGAPLVVGGSISLLTVDNNVQALQGLITWAGLTNFYVGPNIGSNNPGINFDANDSIQYNRSTDTMSFTANGTDPLAPAQMLWFVSGAQRMRLDNVGNLAITGILTQGSDERLKTDIATIEHALDQVCALRGVTYTRTDSGKPHMGLIAQELQSVFPQSVHMNQDGMLSVDYSSLIGVLIEAVKELKHMMDAR